MILKERDSQEAQIEALRKAVGRAGTPYERRWAEKELTFALAGVDGEKEAAYHIDFYLKNSKNWIVLHDLRLECEGRVAQIDHLLINRLLETYVVESKNLKTKVRYQNGGWERLKGNEWEGFPCPIEQNRRHILVLKELIEARQLSPTRLGVSLSSYFNAVVVNPICSIVGSFPKDARVWKMDALVRELRNDSGNPFALLSVVASETLEAFGRKLLACHQPAPGSRRDTGVELRDAPTAALTAVPAAGAEFGAVCEECGGQVTKAEAYFCRMNKARFASKVLCRKCQEFVPKAAPKAAAKVSAAARCVECGTDVDDKVVAFCRLKSKRFGGRLLCRTCQGKA